MVLTSLRYIVFLAAVAALYYVSPPRFRSRFLLAASYVFYGFWQPGFCLLLAAATLVSWLCAAAGKKRLGGRGRLWFVLGALYLFGVLFLYKYLDFFCRSLQLLFGRPADFSSGLLLPIGISFYTFSAAAYLFDVGAGRVEPEPDLFHYALYVAFFPAVLSGPINRPGALLPQLRSPRPFSYPRFKRGLLRLAVGAVKKVVLADSIALFVNAVYADLGNAPRAVLLLAVLGYSFQIYFDFAGYTDMALGSALILGYELPENFRAPYLAESVKDFWRRWHISLTSWFRDYLYFPLGGSRVSRPRLWGNILIVFAVSGLWHGAGGSFLLWGLLNGLFQILEQLLAPPFAALRRRLRITDASPVRAALRCLRSFLLVTLAWVFFRADTTAEALRILRGLFVGAGGFSLGMLHAYTSLRRFALALLGTLLFSLADARLVRTGRGPLAGLEEKSWAYWLFLCLAVFSVALFGCYGGFSAQNFVYFQF